MKPDPLTRFDPHENRSELGLGFALLFCAIAIGVILAVWICRL